MVCVAFPYASCYYAEVKTGGKILLGIFGFLLMVSIIVAQAVFRFEHTALSYTYMSKQLERTIAPLRDPGFHLQAANGTFDYLRHELSIFVPPKLEPYIQGAVTVGFDFDWFLRTGKRMLFNTQGFLNGKEAALSLPVSFDSFKLALMDIVRSEFDTSEYLEMDREVSRMTSSIDLGALLPENDISWISIRLKNSRAILIFLAYVLPCVLFLLCFVTRKIGYGLAVSGISLLTGGGLVMITSLSMRNAVFRAVSSGIDELLPSFLAWFDDGVGMLAGDVVAELLPPSIVIAGFGLVLAVLGMLLIIRKKDLMIKTAPPH